MSGELRPVYLLTGSDRPKVERALQRLRARVGEEAVEVLSATEANGDDAVAACNSLGLLASRRLVIVQDVERWRAADVKAVAGYLDDPVPGVVLALVGEGVKRDAPIAKLAAKFGDLLVYDVAKGDLPRWVADQFRRLGAEVDPAACRALVEIVGDDLHALAGEVEKLAVWAGGEPIGEREVELLAAPSAQMPGFALTDAWGRRDVPAVLEAADSMLERSGEHPSRVIARLVGLLTHHVTRVRACQTLAAEGVRPRDAAPQLKVHPYAAEKAFAHAENFSAEELREVVVRLAELDLALKGAGRLGNELELERALVDVTRVSHARGRGS